MNLLEKFLDLPHATLAFYVVVVLTVIAYLNGTISYEAAIGSVAAAAAGAGVLGLARNGVGRGLKK